ncbi:MAG: hypothetical protein R3F55_17120 [Alphaproteobacteria bacterium]
MSRWLCGLAALPTLAGVALAQQPTWSPAAFTEPPRVGRCAVFPADNPWNWDIAAAPVAPDSAAIVARLTAGEDRMLRADFGEDPDYGIPYAVVGAGQPPVPVRFTDYADESDPGPYPIPDEAVVEGGNDDHVLVVDADGCRLYELYRAARTGAGWSAESGAVFDLSSNALRPLGWTSADAAGLPIFPGLVRYDEVASGTIRHALRVTLPQTRRGFVPPATHWASQSDDPDLPPMGLRLRLRADFDLAGFEGQARVILEALKRYGLIVADNGTGWFVSGAPSPGWVDDDLAQLRRVPGTAFEVVVTGPVYGPGDF